MFLDMTQVNQFESIFRSALTDTYEYALPEVKSVLLVTDRREKNVQDYLKDIQKFLSVLGTSVTWSVLNADDYKTTQDLLDRANQENPDIICSYRNLKSKDWVFKHSLGSYLDVLIQRAKSPVLVLPHPDADYAHDHTMENTNKVMAITSHLSNDHQLINYALRFTQSNGSLFLSHIEDQMTFDRYVDVISKISAIDTDEAKEKISAQLLKEPAAYIESCKQTLLDKNSPVTIESIVTFGNHLNEYKKLVLDHQIDLLVMHAKDHDQLAMHGMAYPLAVELRQVPLLML